MNNRQMGFICPRGQKGQNGPTDQTKQQIEQVKMQKKQKFQTIRNKSKSVIKRNNITNNQIYEIDNIYNNKDDNYVQYNNIYISNTNNNNIIYNNDNNNNDNDNNDNDNNDNDNNDNNYTSNRYNKNNSNFYQISGEYGLCGIKNIGNNCYLNSGLQILARCSSFVEKLQHFYSRQYPFISLLYDAFIHLLSKNEYDPSKFVKYFCSKNKDFNFGEQSCSQNFIRTVLNNVNDEIKYSNINCVYSYTDYKPTDPDEINAYNFYIKENKIYPESEALFTFSGILKSHTYGICKCNNIYNNYTFCYFIDQNMYLDNIYQRCTFDKVIKENISCNDNIEMECQKCKKIMKIKEETKIVKLPEILIFTLERFLGGTNKVEIIPNDKIDLKKYVDPNINISDTKYELFAINIRFGSTKKFGHEICQIKIKGNWFEFNDSSAYMKKNNYYDCSYGLYYKKVNNY